MGGYVTATVLAILAIVGFRFGIKHRQTINELRPPKSSWRQGHKLRIKSAAEIAAETNRRFKPSYARMEAQRIRRSLRHKPVDENDLEELEGMFGSAGDSPEDYK